MTLITSNSTTEIINFGAEEESVQQVCVSLKATLLAIEYHRFPDGESYVRVIDEGKDLNSSRVIIVSNLHQPDDKMLQLYFLCETLREMGVTRIELLAPYLPYMRQDIRFKPGEGITSRYFATWVSQFVDRLITVDPHLHRYKALADIYPIETELIHASNSIAKWIENNVADAILIGPDSESEQWVKAVAEKANRPFIVLEKIRRGDRDVEVSVPDAGRYQHCTPVLIDDIISTGKTMLQTAVHLQHAGFKKPICIGVHAVCSDSDYQQLIAGYVEKVVSCNTIHHESNGINIMPTIIDRL
ncbi:MAG: ribose-phosphate diphosphokinase [Pseudomonadales bacterium]|nr:ribose-phosphate diphosphokinase [Pseudomonadales bacterium]